MTAIPVDGSEQLAQILDELTERIARYRVSDFVLLYCNHAYANALGTTRQELLGRRLDEFLTPDEQVGLHRQVGRLGPELPFLRDSVTRDVGGRWIEWSDLYLPGPVTPQILAVGRDVTERHEAETQLAASEQRFRSLALRDELTGLANRRLLVELLTAALSRARRQGHALAVTYLDLDRFKEVNDTYGHHVGDAVLTEIAARLTACVRDADVIARIGGDEFVVVQECRPSDVAKLAARVASTLSQPIRVGDLRLSSSASTGTVCARPDDDVHSLLQAADAAMYETKRQRHPRAS